MSTDANRKQWKDNHVLVVNAYTKLYSEKMKAPTLKEIVAESGLSYVTVFEHVKKMDLKEFTNNAKGKGKALELLDALYEKGLSGDAQAIKLYFQLTYNWSEKQKQEIEIKNKTVKVIFDDAITKQDDLNDISDIDLSGFEELLDEDN